MELVAAGLEHRSLALGSGSVDFIMTNLSVQVVLINSEFLRKGRTSSLSDLNETKLCCLEKEICLLEKKKYHAH